MGKPKAKIQKSKVKNWASRFHAKAQRKRKDAKENFSLRLCVSFASLRETNSPNF
jgi:hypothetical protein